MQNYNKVLYHKTKNGGLNQWRTWADGANLHTEYGQVGGKLQTSTKECLGKNLGKKNERTPEQQAESESEALFTYRLERKYSLTPEEAREPLLFPMLAHTYSEKKHTSLAYYAQPKLDGFRCLARWEDGEVKLYSRQGKLYDVKHISDILATFLPQDVILDGELYIHGLALQNFSSFVKKPQEGSENVTFAVYDAVLSEEGCDESFRLRHVRYLMLLKPVSEDEILSETAYSNILCVNSFIISNHKEDIDGAHKRMITAGFEGLMLRTPGSKYLFGYRSHDLLKVKSWRDSEFKVVDVKSGEGKMKGCGILVCLNDLNDETFDVTEKTTMERRAWILENKKLYIGQQYTVKFFDRTEKLIPRFCVGLGLKKDRC